MLAVLRRTETSILRLSPYAAQADIPSFRRFVPSKMSPVFGFFAVNIPTPWQRTGYGRGEQQAITRQNRSARATQVGFSCLPPPFGYLLFDSRCALRKNFADNAVPSKRLPVLSAILGGIFSAGPVTSTSTCPPQEIFTLTEPLKMDFRAEFFNVLNHPNFGVPDNFQQDRRSSAGWLVRRHQQCRRPAHRAAGAEVHLLKPMRGC
jgi:hypothetical protein